jgi:hypothetical protein
VLLDTGMGNDPDVDTHYRPARRPLPAVLADAAMGPEDVAVAVNCHLLLERRRLSQPNPARPSIHSGVSGNGDA